MGELQRGIYWDRGQTPPRHFAIAFLKATAGADAAAVGGCLDALASLWNGLREGIVPELGELRVPPSDFEWLIGYGTKTFALDGRSPGRVRPHPLRFPNLFNSVQPGIGGPVVANSGIRFASELALNPATEEVAVQLTGATPLSVNRALVETWKLLEEMRDPVTERAPLALSASFTGFNREDHRSWIGFHDGVSNLAPDQRRSAIAVQETGLSNKDAWTKDGTYLVFMRLAVDLRLWGAVAPTEQEILVGRTKITGCPLTRVENGVPTPVEGCPAHGSTEVSGPGNGNQPSNQPFQEPTDGVDQTIRQSHVQRANHHGDPSPRGGQRFFRQGYEYLEPPVPGKPLQAGLNFVSFQEHPERLFATLTRDSWLGGTNFGGNPGPDLITAYGAGVYFCPAQEEGEAFPGRSIFFEP